jgi:hypothetical protein
MFFPPFFNVLLAISRETTKIFAATLAIIALVGIGCSRSNSKAAEAITRVLTEHYQIAGNQPAAAEKGPERLIKTYPELLTIRLEGCPQEFVASFGAYRGAMEKAFKAAVELRNQRIIERNEMAATGSSEKFGTREALPAFTAACAAASKAFGDVLTSARKHGAAMPREQ